MFRKIIIGLVLSIVCFTSICFAEGYSPKVGDSLQYKIIAKSWIHGGNQYINIVNRETYKGHDVFMVHSVLETIGIIKSITKYSEVEDMALDASGFFPWYIRRECHEGENTRVDEISIDYEKGVGERITTAYDGNKSRSEIKIPGYVFDALSLQFYLRKDKFINKINKLYFYGDGNISDVNFETEEVNKPLHLDSGTFPKYDQFSDPKSKITVLISDDAQRLPIVIRQIGGFGKVEAKLAKYTGMPN